jgi:hypothetical protein
MDTMSQALREARRLLHEDVEAGRISEERADELEADLESDYRQVPPPDAGDSANEEDDSVSRRI